MRCPTDCELADAIVYMQLHLYFEFSFKDSLNSNPIHYRSPMESVATTMQVQMDARVIMHAYVSCQFLNR